MSCLLHLNYKHDILRLVHLKVIFGHRRKTGEPVSSSKMSQRADKLSDYTPARIRVNIILIKIGL